MGTDLSEFRRGRSDNRSWRERYSYIDKDSREVRISSKGKRNRDDEHETSQGQQKARGKEKGNERILKRKFEGTSEILSWVVNKSRKTEENVDLERQKAKQRYRILDEQDNVVAAESLAGDSVVLTLKDQEILAGGNVNESVDVLENVEIGEQKCRNDKFNEQSGEERKMLLHYDDPNVEDVAGCRKVDDLNSSVQIASEYFTPEEMLQFKKSKKKKSLRKREKLDIDFLEAEAKAEGLGASDLRSRSDSKSRVAKEEQEMAEAIRRSSAYQAAFAKADEASRALRLEQTLSTVKDEDDTDVFAEDDEDLQKSLERARKLGLKKQTKKLPDELDAIACLAASAVSTQSADSQNSNSEDALDNKVVFTEMEEFVWGLRSDEALEASEEKKDKTGGWTEILESVTDEPSKTENIEKISRDDIIYEAPAGKGLSGALQLFKDRGTLKETIEQTGRSTMRAIHDDDGPKEIDLVRRDEFGRVLTQREAFRRLCHKFHGKGPGKRKQGKLIKQYQDELKLKQMTSSDVLPQSVERMREALSQSRTPYIVLSGHVRPR